MYAIRSYYDSLGPIVVLVVGGYMVIQKQTDVSTLVVFISGFQRLSGPWDQLVTFYRTVSNARVTYGLIADALADFVDLVIPELRRRGLVRTEYEGKTLREHFGLPRPQSRYARRLEPA